MYYSVGILSVCLILMSIFKGLFIYTILTLVLGSSISSYLVSIFTYIPEITSENLRLVYPIILLVSILLGKIMIFSTSYVILDYRFYFISCGIISMMNFILIK